MENFDNVYTVEGWTSKECFEVFSTWTSLNDAVKEFKRLCMNKDGQYRITTPKGQ